MIIEKFAVSSIPSSLWIVSFSFLIFGMNIAVYDDIVHYWFFNLWNFCCHLSALLIVAIDLYDYCNNFIVRCKLSVVLLIDSMHNFMHSPEYQC